MKRDFFYVAACGVGEGAGIHTISLNGDDICERRHFLPFEGASYFWSSPDGRFLYLADESPVAGGVASFRRLPDGALEKCGERLSSDVICCHVTTSPDGRFLFASDYRHGQLLEYPLNPETGAILPPEQIIRHTGKGPNAARQESAHIHSAICSPDGKWLCVADLGEDTLSAYPLTKKGLDDVSGYRISWMTPGSGPRHFLFSLRHPGTAWLLNELDCTVNTLDFNDGDFRIRQTHPLLAGDKDVPNKASALRLAPDGGHLLASVRGEDTILSFPVLEGGSLGKPKRFPCIVSSPRDFNFLPGGNRIACGGENSNDVILFEYNTKTGELTPDLNSRILSLPRPICFL